MVLFTKSRQIRALRCNGFSANKLVSRELYSSAAFPSEVTAHFILMENRVEEYLCLLIVFNEMKNPMDIQ